MPTKASPPARLRCFVAMAFGRGDTDQWYKSTLAPLLRRHRLTPRRVDLITHNDDVDDRILVELARADMVVADLTYARPSVYFEAGHADGRKLPIIYTCRADHLKPGAIDPHRVHFDLQMKNIVDWKGPRDPLFIRRMEKQVTFVVTPLRTDLAEKSRRRQAEKTFTAMSQSEQLAAVATQVEKRAIGHGFKVETFLDSATGMAFDTYFPRASLVVGRWFKAGHLHGFQCMVRQSFKQSDLDLANALVRRPRFNVQLPRSSNRLSDVADLLLIVSLRPLQLARVRQTLDSFHAIDTTQKHVRRGVKQSLPHLRAPGFEQVIHLATGLTGIVGRTHERVHLNEVHGDVLPGKEQGHVTYDPPLRYIRTATVPRRIDVCVIDSVASLDRLRERVELALLRFDRSLSPEMPEPVRTRSAPAG